MVILNDFSLDGPMMGATTKTQNKTKNTIELKRNKSNEIIT